MNREAGMQKSKPSRRWSSAGLACLLGLCGCTADKGAARGDTEAEPRSPDAMAPGATPSSGAGGGATVPSANGGASAGEAPAETTTDTGEVFIGPFATWANVRVDYGAVGDGVTDDSAALQRALDDVGAPDQPRVLFFPAGSYRLEHTLRLFEKLGVALLGEDPLRTKLVWAGPSQGSDNPSDNTGVMLLNQGSTGFRVGRLTFDGQGKAAYGIRHRWGSYASGELFPSGIEHHDLSFQNLGIGISAGFYDGVSPQDTAEYSHVIRSEFIGCKVGVETADFNSLLWGVLDSKFVDNEVGVRVALGNANVYDSVFLRSSEADISAGNIPFLGVRGNFSSGSRHFFTAENPLTLTLQGNTIVGAVETPIVVPNILSLALLDNTIDSGPTPPLELNQRGALLSSGNVLSAASLTEPGDAPLASRSLDDELQQTIVTSPPELPGFLPQFAGEVHEVEGATAADVQAAIDQVAGTHMGEPVVLHLARPDIPVSETIEIPAGVDIRLVGDGAGTKLTWTGGARGELLRLVGPSRAKLQDLELSGGYNGSSADTLVIQGADQPGGSVIFYSLAVVKENTSGVALSVEGVDETKIELVLPHYMGGAAGAVRVVGGPGAAALQGTPPNVRVLDAFPRSGSGDTYQVSEGGRVLLLDQWAETDQRHYIRLSDSARVTLSNASFGFGPPLAADDDPVIGASGLSGALAVVGGIFAGSVLAASGDNPQQNMLVALTGLGGWGLPDDGSKFVQTQSAGEAHLLLSASAKFDAASPPNEPDVSDPWLRGMLADLRSDSSLRLRVGPLDATEVRVCRVRIGIADNAVRISR